MGICLFWRGLNSCQDGLGHLCSNKLASLGATLVRNSAHLITDSLTGVKCRATSVAKNRYLGNAQMEGVWLSQKEDINRKRTSLQFRTSRMSSLSFTSLLNLFNKGLQKLNIILRLAGSNLCPLEVIVHLLVCILHPIIPNIQAWLISHSEKEKWGGGNRYVLVQNPKGFFTLNDQFLLYMIVSLKSR